MISIKIEKKIFLFLMIIHFLIAFVYYVVGMFNHNITDFCICSGAAANGFYFYLRYLVALKEEEEEENGKL